MDLNHRNFEAVVFGATGYTGRLVCDYLKNRAKETGQRWAVAGRREDVLKELVGTCGADGYVVADCLKSADCEKVAQASRVIANLAGPYFERAEGIVEACARRGTHYLDLTGELIFVRGLIDRFHDMAVKSGAKIVPVAGYEAMPFDLMALRLLESYWEMFGANPASIDLLVRPVEAPPEAKGLDQMISGGTAETMRTLLDKDFSSISADPTALNARNDPYREEIRRAMPYRLRPCRDDLERWSIPIFPTPFLHPAIFNRTVSILRAERIPISTGIRYRERASLGGGGNGFKRMITAYLVAGLGASMGWLMSSSVKWLRRIVKTYLDKYCPHPGNGPDLSHIDLWKWGIDGKARGERGVVSMSLQAQGHPGYRTTANMIGEGALILADLDAETPARAGILTPALALGTAELKRFSRAGMTFSCPV